VLTPLWSKWLGTGFILLVLTPVLSRLFAHMLVSEFHVGGLENVCLIDSGCSRRISETGGGSPASPRWCQIHTSPLGTMSENECCQKVRLR
jgi:hypothetical protein